METLGFINEREVLYLKHHIGINWSKELPISNWLLVAIVELDNTSILDEIARKVIDKDVCYACCTGTFGEKMHDLIDENLVIRETEIEELHFPNHQVMTIWHKDTVEGLWFAAYSSFHETELIERIVCLDIGKDSNKEAIVELIDKFKSGYIPDN